MNAPNNRKRPLKNLARGIGRIFRQEAASTDKKPEANNPIYYPDRRRRKRPVLKFILKSVMNKKRILGIIRHLIGGAGAFAVGMGHMDEGTATELTGAVMFIASIVASYLSPEKTQ